VAFEADEVEKRRRCGRKRRNIAGGGGGGAFGLRETKKRGGHDY
jgi:hypothetical protein